MDYTIHEILQARMLDSVTFPSSRGSPQPRDWTQVSRVAGWFFTSWAPREASYKKCIQSKAFTECFRMQYSQESTDFCSQLKLGK